MTWACCATGACTASSVGCGPGAGPLRLRNIPAYLHLRARAAAAGGVEAVVGQPDGHAPLLVGTDQISFVDIDDTMKAIYGYAKQGAGYGYNGVKELNALFGTVTTPTGAPVPLTRPVPE